MAQLEISTFDGGTVKVTKSCEVEIKRKVAPPPLAPGCTYSLETTRRFGLEHVELKKHCEEDSPSPLNALDQSMGSGGVAR